MKIAIDVFPIMQPKTGVGHYTYHLISNFAKLAPENEYYLCDALGGIGFYNMVHLKADLSKSNSFLRISTVPFPFVTLCRLFLLLSNKLKGSATTLEQADIFFGTNYRGRFSDSFQTVLTIHDMAHAYFPETIEENSLKYLTSELPEAAARARIIIAVSETTRQDIIKVLGIAPERVKVVYNGVDEVFRPLPDSDALATVRERYELPAKFILSVGTVQPRKNIEALISAFALLRADFPDHYLVLAGGTGWKSEGLKAFINGKGLEGKVHLTGYVDQDDLPALYNLAEVFAFPSLYEGFGLPVLEAMACGIPVVTSNTSCLPEIAGDAAILVDPGKVEEIAQGIGQLLSSAELRNQCREKGLERVKLFTWEQCARGTLAVLREALEAS